MKFPHLTTPSLIEAMKALQNVLPIRVPMSSFFLETEVLLPGQTIPQDVKLEKVVDGDAARDVEVLLVEYDDSSNADVAFIKRALHLGTSTRGYVICRDDVIGYVTDHFWTTDLYAAVAIAWSLTKIQEAIAENRANALIAGTSE